VTSAGPAPILVETVLRGYGFDHFEIMQPQTGYRNWSYPVMLRSGVTINCIVYKNESKIIDKIRAAHHVSNKLHALGLPVRYPLMKRIACLTSGQAVRYAALYNYLPGSTIPWEAYTMDHLKALGMMMGKMHVALRGVECTGLPSAIEECTAQLARMKHYFSQRQTLVAMTQKLGVELSEGLFEHMYGTILQVANIPMTHALHMDFVRSNILFKTNDVTVDLKIQISGVLDFEKVAIGPPIMDIARTYAFLCIDCKYKTTTDVYKYFVRSGYIKRGGANVIAAERRLLTPLTEFFIFYDFYKFLRHNPYESLCQNEHYVRTVSYLRDSRALRLV
jgi:Ser/Thr protein kinase RdoA (MazF antagonist)